MQEVQELRRVEYGEDDAVYAQQLVKTEQAVKQCFDDHLTLRDLRVADVLSFEVERVKHDRQDWNVPDAFWGSIYPGDKAAAGKEWKLRNRQYGDKDLKLMDQMFELQLGTKKN